MELQPIYKRVVGLDVHHKQITACAIIEGSDGQVQVRHREFGAFKRDRRALAEWCAALEPEVVVMESTGIYWRSPYAILEKYGIRATVVNARHVKQVPGRKTDVGDAQWLATLARAGLLRGSFVPPARMRELRVVARQRVKLKQELSRSKNRFHKILADAGVRLGTVVSDLHGQSARAMLKELLKGSTPQQAVRCASKRLKAGKKELAGALEGELTQSHLFVLQDLLERIEDLEARICSYDEYLLEQLEPEHNILALLQTIPGVDLIGAALLLVEIGPDMTVFGSADRLASWVGICPGNNESAGKHKSGRIRKGNTYARRVLCEFAHAAVRTPSAFKAKFQTLMPRRGYKRAIIAIAHKILRTIFYMISRNEPYRDSTVDYEALYVKRNAPRWIRMLVKFGYIAQPQNRS